jgi:nitrite reductase/ring-hydroxylating ferredoxin subunit
VGDRLFAYRDVCPHAFWPLSDGTVHDTVLECPGHGWQFDAETGACITAPSYCLTPVQVTIVDESAQSESAA